MPHVRGGIYSGTIWDLRVVGEAIGETPALVIVILDLPLSLAADTVLLPYTVPMAFKDQPDDENEPYDGDEPRPQ